ncbi:MAG: DEAD/DEAH box helicase [Planctomycetes bacterium]|nr:DEAD/DEAH box helicase [Planctomycetota bacterium]
MAFIPDKSLDSVTAADIPLAQGAPVDDVREIRRTPTALAARLKGIRVTISADLEEALCSTCPSSPCPHIAAALLAWVKKRVPVREPKRLGLVDRLLLGPGWKNLDDFVADTLQGAIGEADVREDGSLEVRLVARGRTATITLPSDEAPPFLWNLPKGVTKSERLRRTRVSRRPIEPELRAEYDERKRLVLRPVWGEGIAPKNGARWHFDGAAYHPLGTAPRDLRSYFKGERVIEEDDIPAFIESEFRSLCTHSAFKPSAEVRDTQVAPRPTLSAVRVKGAGGDWLELDPVYTAGDHRLAMSEILAVQGKKKFIRKGNTWIPADPIRTYGGPTRMRRAEFIFQKPDVPIEGDLPSFDPDAEDPLPKGLLTILRPYQKVGYEWMRYLRRAGLHGVLADDMGLGKTHQAMSFLLSLYEQGATRPSLIVAPTSVLEPWIQKMRQFAPGLRPYRYYGPDRKPEMLRLPGQRAVVTTYTVLIRDIDALSAMDWECVILDEAQYIKTMATQFARAAKQLNAGTRLALTGTPIENRLDELWSIYDFCLPGYLGSAEKFRERFEIPIVRKNDVFSLEKLKKMIAPFKLRRVKSEVLQDLPPKVEDVRMCDLSPHQAALYRTLVDRDGQALAEELRDTGRRINYISVFAALSKLKRVCDHPALVVDGARASDLASGKFDVFKELLDEALRSGQKVVVFTQYLQMMDIIEDHLRMVRVPFTEIRGDTRDRAEAIRRFNDDEDCRVFVCSLMAGGVGIDLTSASVVIHYDRWWNAAREDQATDRVHRIGQRRGVQVFKLVTRGTLEERIDRMIAAKGELMNSVVDADAGSFRRFGREELIELLTGARQVLSAVPV